MYHVRHRVYDPARMLWIQRDPLGRLPGANEYAYCLGEPVDLFDPMGLFSLSDALQIANAALQGAHDGLVVTSNAMVNTLTGGAIGYTRDELSEMGALYDPENRALKTSEAAGKGGAVAVVFTIVVMSGGALAPEFAATMGGAAAINAVGGAAASIYVQSYEVRAGQRSEISTQQVLFDAAFAGVLGGAAQGLSNYLRFGPNLTEVVLGRPTIREVISSGCRAGSYGLLAAELKGTGLQANHINQAAVYDTVIPRSEAAANAMRGNAFRDVGSPHYEFHAHLETFWNRYRPGGAFYGSVPTNAEYLSQLEPALVRAGYSPAEAARLSRIAATEQAAYGLAPSAEVPRIPGRLPQRR